MRGVWIAFAAILAGSTLGAFLLWRALGGDGSEDPARTAGRVFLAVLLGIAVAGAALGVGIAAALGGGVVIASLAVVTGLVLIGTAFVGGIRWLIVPALALVLPLGVVDAADIDLEGGIGEREYRPATMSQLRDHYEIGIGGLDVDLTDLDLPTTGRTDVDIDVGLGEAVIYVPEGACVTSDVEIGAGAADIFDRDNDGVDIAFAETASPPAGRPMLHIQADVGLGLLEVVREGSLPDRGRRHQDFEIFDARQDAPFEGGTGCA